MSEQLYNTRILRLAASIPHQARLTRPQASVTRVSPICGSRVTVDVDSVGGVVAAFGQEVRACALGQASASILGATVLGAPVSAIAAARDQLRSYLAGEGDVPAAPFQGLEVFAPALPYRARHASILLAWEAAVEALYKAEKHVEHATHA